MLCFCYFYSILTPTWQRHIDSPGHWSWYGKYPRSSRSAGPDRGWAHRSSRGADRRSNMQWVITNPSCLWPKDFGWDHRGYEMQDKACNWRTGIHFEINEKTKVFQKQYGRFQGEKNFGRNMSTTFCGSPLIGMNPPTKPSLRTHLILVPDCVITKPKLFLIPEHTSNSKDDIHL